MRSLNTSTPRRQNSCSGQPAISVDTKKKEQIGEYKNGGREWHPKSQPESVHVHDFAKQKDVPDGVYDLGQNAGWVSVGTDHDMSAIAVVSIRRWWNMMGRDKKGDSEESPFLTS
jgi:hypothetical protein